MDQESGKSRIPSFIGVRPKIGDIGVEPAGAIHLASRTVECCSGSYTWQQMTWTRPWGHETARKAIAEKNTKHVHEITEKLGENPP
jgi:hypothetical protein